MELFTDSALETLDREVFGVIEKKEWRRLDAGIISVIGMLYDAIPEHKRISYGIVHTVKLMSQTIAQRLQSDPESMYETGARCFENASDFKSRMVGLGLISIVGLSDYRKALPVFLRAAASEDWNDREICQMHFRKLIAKYPAEMQEWLLGLTQDRNPNIRRFVAETIRPVCENKWFFDDPEFSLKILRNLFREKAAYPRTSVGNNLSDLARRHPEMVYGIVEELVATGDKNSHWIATRACRNLVKKEPERVMNLLKTDRYKYKDREYFQNTDRE